jgi:hypothetical protein
MGFIKDIFQEIPSQGLSFLSLILQNSPKCPSEACRWTKLFLYTSKMSFGRVPMDKTLLGHQQNVLRMGSDGQKYPWTPVKCLSDGFRWTKLSLDTHKMSFGRVPMDKTLLGHQQNVLRMGSDGQNSPWTHVNHISVLLLN